VKPQFEVGKAGIGRGGIVKDESLYLQVEDKIKTAATAAGFKVKDYFSSSIAGGDGNREFFISATAV
ncbi:MAG: SAM-dependent methyltransferase, partial [Iodobacter sp.]